jgi:deoxyxylulose-5-phosphate synthase
VSTDYLSQIHGPDDLKRLPIDALPALAAEMRERIIQVVSRTGGHLAPSLGTVELTVALHYVFDTPRDVLVWDVGHQAYGHKILTGRNERFDTLRQEGASRASRAAPRASSIRSAPRTRRPPSPPRSGSPARAIFAARSTR